ncbi:MAG: sulfurtransferase [Gammaproteobacteria bacterium]|jgi:thiosulfate/3-mercaptopyruvate sulfurtransferase|nr:sulfurtransferase [Gammaproteobacteria bacterium]
MSLSLPLIIEPEQLEEQLGTRETLIVDLCKPETYARSHIPGAVHLEYRYLVAPQPPAMGCLPSEVQLTQVLSALGLSNSTSVFAYDDEGGGRAARLLWTLDAVGHSQGSLLNGGLHAWVAENRRLDNEAVTPTQNQYQVTINDDAIADKAYILRHLDDPSVQLVDTRSPAEYHGQQQRAERAGHIPGAVNFDWVNAMDPTRNLRLRTADELKSRLTSLGVVPEKEIVTYCHTHHRSAHTYITLKSLGYERVRGYPGSWSEWGNSPEVPIA